ncbi:MAG: cupin domain-containing protein [Candidatus Tectomicrobia bacterium]|nr:cupin domain-containing protein [Candidatus Tectomicrobia bacterium]
MNVYQLDTIPKEEVNEEITRRLITGSNVMLCFFNFKRGSKVPPHRHVNEQISYVLEGSLRFRIGNEEQVVSAGQVVHIPSNTEHEVEVLDEGASVLDIFSPIRQDFLDGTDTYLRKK